MKFLLAYITLISVFKMDYKLLRKTIRLYFGPLKYKYYIKYMRKLRKKGCYDEALEVILFLIKKMVVKPPSTLNLRKLHKELMLFDDLEKNDNFFIKHKGSLSCQENLLLASMLCVPDEGVISTFETFDDDHPLCTERLIEFVACVRVLKCMKEGEDLAVLLAGKSDERLVKMLSHKLNVTIISSRKLLTKPKLAIATNSSSCEYFIDNICTRNSYPDLKIARGALHLVEYWVRKTRDLLSFGGMDQASIETLSAAVGAEVHTQLYNILRKLYQFNSARVEVGVSNFVVLGSPALHHMLNRKDVLGSEGNNEELFKKAQAIHSAIIPPCPSSISDDEIKKDTDETREGKWVIPTNSDKESFRNSSFLSHFIKQVESSRVCEIFSGASLVSEARYCLDKVLSNPAAATNIQKNDVSLGHIDCVVYFECMKNWFIAIEGYKNSLHYLSKENVQAVIYVSSDRAMALRVFQAACGTMGVPTFLYSYLFISSHPLYYKPAAKYVLTPDYAYQNNICKIFGCDDLSMVNVGSHMVSRRLERIESYGREALKIRTLRLFDLSSESRVILVASQPWMFEHTITALHHMMAASAAQDNLVFVIRPHPGVPEDGRRYQQWVEQNSYHDRIIVDDTHDLTDWIVTSSLVITFFSNVGTEAAAVGTPVLTITIPGVNFPVDLEEIGVAISSEINESFKDVVYSIINRKEYYEVWKKRSDEYFSKNPQLRDVGIENNIIAAVESLVNDR